MKILLGFLNIINSILPKSNYVILFSFPDLDGNVYSLYKYIVENHPEFTEKYRVIWMVNGDTDYAKKRIEELPNSQNVVVCKKRSVKGLYLYCKSLYIITTHNYYTGLYTKGKQKNYNLWHGMPFKAIGYSMAGSPDVIQADYTLATSEMFQEIMEQAVGMEKDKVLVTGQPCTDELFNTQNSLYRLGIDKNKYSKVLIWMPTYRNSDVGSIRQDGKSDSFGLADVFNFHLPELRDVLQKHNMLLIIKPHPMDVLRSQLNVSEQNISVIKNEDLAGANVSLYQLIGEADVLLTDYSSVFIDFLNLGRPVAFLYDDLDEYASNRGFCFDKPEDYLPGEKISNFNGLIEYLDNIDEKNAKWDKENKRINELFNKYSDGHSSERVFKAIFQ